MTVTKEEICMLVLDEICKENFEQDEYCLRGPKESAVCMEKGVDGWSVYENERNSRNDTSMFDNIIEAALDLLQRLCTSVDYGKTKDAFLNAIVGQLQEKETVCQNR